MAEILDFSSSGMLHPIASHTRLGATLRRAGGGYGNVFFLPKSIDGQFLAGNRLRLVLSFDGFFCSLGKFSHMPGSNLASLDVLAG
ncbi:MAG: hypothetical protein ABSF60_04460 [Verrucomicrobiota bacterium]